MLGMYINTIFRFMDKSYKPPSNILKAFFQTMLTFITKKKKELNNQTILNQIQKAVDAFF